MKKIIQIIRNDKDIRYGTVMLIISCLLVVVIATVMFIAECVKFPL